MAQLDFNCLESGDCAAKANRLVVDSNMLISLPEFTCVKASCVENFTLNIGNLDDGKKFVAHNIVTKSFIDLNDLSSITFKRAGKLLSFDGKVHILVGKINFELKTDIVTLNKDILELHISKVKVADFLSLTDFTMFFAKKILSTKAFTMNGDNLIIKLH